MNPLKKDQSPVRVVEGLVVLTSVTNFWFQQEVSQMPGNHSHVTNRAQKSTLVFSESRIVVKPNGHLKSPILLYHRFLTRLSRRSSLCKAVKDRLKMQQGCDGDQVRD